MSRETPQPQSATAQAHDGHEPARDAAEDDRKSRASKEGANGAAGDAAARRMAHQGDLPLGVDEDPEFVRAEQAVERARGAAAKAPAGEPRKDDKKPDAAPKKEEMTGIGSSIAVGRFVAEAKKVQTGWDKLKPEERADHLGKAANAELKAVCVPEVANKVEDLGQNAGQLHFKDWTLGLGKAPFSQAKVTDAEAADMADTVFHESRHAEQWHRMARHLAAKGKKGSDIATEMGIPEPIATDATKKPIDAASQEGKEAQSFYDSVYGANSDHRTKVLNDLAAKGTARRTTEASYRKLAADAHAKPDDVKAAKAAWDKAVADFNAVYKLYVALPEEADAWKAGGAVTEKYLAKP